MRSRPITALFVALAVAVPAAPALAGGLPGGPTAAAKQSAAKPSKPSKPNKPSHPVKRVSFSYNGTLTAVDVAAGTVTMKVRGGGSTALRGKNLTLAVPGTAVVRLNDTVATLGDLAVGDSLQVKGDRVGSVHTVRRVSAKVHTVAPTPTPTPSVTPSPEPTETPETPETP